MTRSHFRILTTFMWIIVAVISLTVYAQENETIDTGTSDADTDGSNYRLTHEEANFYTNGTVQATPPWEVERDPFWPIDWQPLKPKPIEIEPEETNNVDVAVEPPPVVEPEEPKLDEDWLGAIRKLRVISKKQVDGSWLISLAGLGVKEKGSIITIEYKGNIYTWRIAEINPDSIRFDRVNVRPK